VDLARIVSAISYSILLIGCAFFAAFQTLGFLFGIGESGAPVALIDEVALGITVLGAAGLTISAFGSWARRRTFGSIALVSAFFVLPASALWCWSQGGAIWANTQSGAWHYGIWAWTRDVVLPVPLDVIAIFASWLRFRGTSTRIPQ
jgi:hypothetical protein